MFWFGVPNSAVVFAAGGHRRRERVRVAGRGVTDEAAAHVRRSTAVAQRAVHEERHGRRAWAAPRDHQPRCTLLEPTHLAERADAVGKTLTIIEQEDVTAFDGPLHSRNQHDAAIGRVGAELREVELLVVVAVFENRVGVAVVVAGRSLVRTGDLLVSG